MNKKSIKKYALAKILNKSALYGTLFCYHEILDFEPYWVFGQGQKLHKERLNERTKHYKEENEDETNLSKFKK